MQSQHLALSLWQPATCFLCTCPWLNPEMKGISKALPQHQHTQNCMLPATCPCVSMVPYCFHSSHPGTLRAPSPWVRLLERKHWAAGYSSVQQACTCKYVHIFSSKNHWAKRKSPASKLHLLPFLDFEMNQSETTRPADRCQLSSCCAGTGIMPTKSPPKYFLWKLFC